MPREREARIKGIPLIGKGVVFPLLEWPTYTGLDLRNNPALERLISFDLGQKNDPTVISFFFRDAVEDKIYVAGGSGGGWLSSVEVFDGVQWKLLASSLAEGRPRCAAINFVDTVVVLGGNRETIEQLDLLTGKWNAKSIPAMSTALRSELAVVSY